MGAYPDGAAAFGALDMAGNLWEWCFNNYNFLGNKGLHGGSFSYPALDARCAARNDDPPGFMHSIIGFRVVVGFPDLPQGVGRILEK